MKVKRIVGFVGCVIVATFGLFYLNSLAYHWIFPNPCIYHLKPLPDNVWFHLFYYANAGTGGHPEPSTFNWIFTLVMSILIGWLMYRLLFANRLKRYI